MNNLQNLSPAEFEEVFNQFQTNNPNYIPIYHSHISINENINWFLTSVGFNNNEFKLLEMECWRTLL